MTVGSLFSGIGGFDLGLERAGFEVRWQIERDPWCRRVLAKHWPEVRRYELVENHGADLERVDLVCGGFPCQPVSNNGAGLAQGDDRWLWPEFIRIVRALRPRYVLVENVAGLFTANGGRAFGEVLGDLASSGFDAEWGVLSAAAVGAPHLRERVFVVADADGEHEGRADDGASTIFGPGSSSAGIQGDGFWNAESGVGRVADGVPARVDRLRGLGNAVVPQVVEWIGRRILEC